MPSAKYSCSGSPLEFSNGNTTMERRGAVASLTSVGAPASVARQLRSQETMRGRDNDDRERGCNCRPKWGGVGRRGVGGPSSVGELASPLAARPGANRHVPVA